MISDSLFPRDRLTLKSEKFHPVVNLQGLGNIYVLVNWEIKRWYNNAISSTVDNVYSPKGKSKNIWLEAQLELCYW